MIPKEIQGSPHVPTSASSSEVQSAETLIEKGSEFLDASLPYGSNDVKGKTYVSPESLASKVSEWKLQASARAADLNSQLNAQGPQEPKPKGTARNLEWMVSGVKKEEKPVEGNSTIKDYDKGSMK